METGCEVAKRAYKELTDIQVIHSIIHIKLNIPSVFLKYSTGIRYIANVCVFLPCTYTHAYICMYVFVYTCTHISIIHCSSNE